MSEKTRKHLKPVGNTPEILYGSCKVHKRYADGCPPFGPILSALEAPTYKLTPPLKKILKSALTIFLKATNLLQEEIRRKKSNIRVLRKEFNFLYSILQVKTCFIDFAYICSLFLGHKDKVLKQKRTIQQNKFNNLRIDRKLQLNPEKIIFNILVMFYQKQKILFF